jgi:hypothetical protein
MRQNHEMWGNEQRAMRHHKQYNSDNATVVCENKLVEFLNPVFLTILMSVLNSFMISNL